MRLREERKMDACWEGIGGEEDSHEKIEIKKSNHLIHFCEFRNIARF